MFRYLEENKESELRYSMELTQNLEEPTKTLIQTTLSKNIIGMYKNEKNYYMTRIAELFFASFIIACNMIPLELFSALKIPVILLDVRIWTILFSVCILFCIALDSLFQFRDTWQNQKELVEQLKNECLKYSCQLGVYSQQTEQTERKSIFLQRFLELTGEKYSLFEFHTKQNTKQNTKIEEQSESTEIENQTEKQIE